MWERRYSLCWASLLAIFISACCAIWVVFMSQLCGRVFIGGTFCFLQLGSVWMGLRLNNIFSDRLRTFSLLSVGLRTVHSALNPHFSVPRFPGYRISLSKSVLRLFLGLIFSIQVQEIGNCNDSGPRNNHLTTHTNTFFYQAIQSNNL